MELALAQDMRILNLLIYKPYHCPIGSVPARCIQVSALKLLAQSISSICCQEAPVEILLCSRTHPLMISRSNGSYSGTITTAECLIHSRVVYYLHLDVKFVLFIHLNAR
jgi:hypothetical protein